MEILSATVPNPALPDATLSDADAIWEGASTWQQNLMEYAARVCYASVPRMGHNPNFVAARIKEGHVDVIEHVWVTAEIFGSPDTIKLWWWDHGRYAEIAPGRQPYISTIVSANMRVWLEMSQTGALTHDEKRTLQLIAPGVFAPHPFPEDQPIVAPELTWQGALSTVQVYAPLRVGQATVTLIGANLPPPDLLPDHYDRHASATFLLDGVSRSLTHQLVRHRRFSVSQESRRYVNLEKGNYQPVIPPAVDRDPGATGQFMIAWHRAKVGYTALTDKGVRAEDARYLLPNATTTRIVVTAALADWRHFVWLRALDRAAQWEIRGVGQSILQFLHNLAPAQFKKEHRFLCENLESLSVGLPDEYVRET